MRTATKYILIGGGVICGVVAGLLAKMVTARESEVERVRRKVEADAASGDFSPSVGDTHFQFPAIIARPDADGVVVTLENDTRNRSVLLDSAKDRLVLEYESVAVGPVVRSVPLKTAALAPGETSETVRVPIDGRWKAMTVRFEHRDDVGVHGTEVKLP